MIHCHSFALLCFEIAIALKYFYILFCNNAYELSRSEVFNVIVFSDRIDLCYLLTNNLQQPELPRVLSLTRYMPGFRSEMFILTS